jgi:hypothetical protein
VIDDEADHIYSAGFVTVLSTHAHSFAVIDWHYYTALHCTACIVLACCSTTNDAGDGDADQSMSSASEVSEDVGRTLDLEEILLQFPSIDGMAIRYSCNAYRLMVIAHMLHCISQCSFARICRKVCGIDQREAPSRNRGTHSLSSASHCMAKRRRIGG